MALTGVYTPSKAVKIASRAAVLTDLAFGPAIWFLGWPGNAVARGVFATVVAGVCVVTCLLWLAFTSTPGTPDEPPIPDQPFRTYFTGTFAVLIGLALLVLMPLDARDRRRGRRRGQRPPDINGR